MPDITLLSTEGAAKLGRLVAADQAHRSNSRLPPAIDDPPAGDSYPEYVRLTSDVKDGHGRYPGKQVWQDPRTQAWTDLITVAVVPENPDEILSQGTAAAPNYYPARSWGFAEDGRTPVYVTRAGLTVQLSDKSLSFDGVDTIQLDPPGLWEISSPEKGTVRIAPVGHTGWIELLNSATCDDSGFSDNPCYLYFDHGLFQRIGCTLPPGAQAAAKSGVTQVGGVRRAS